MKKKIPQIQIIKAISKAPRAIIETAHDHNYESGESVTVVVNNEFGFDMRRKTEIDVIDERRFYTDIDTTALPDFQFIKKQKKVMYVPPQCIPVCL